MADLTPKKINLSSINGGREFQNGDGIYPSAVNSAIEGTAYFQTVVDHLVDTPDNSDIDGVGTPDVSFVSSTTNDNVTIYKFKFSNINGATFTPSLDMEGNLSWTNNKGLDNPPTINISGRDYLYSSYEGSGTYIPQPNDTISNIPISSFNREPVDDIDHCYLFYLYTPHNDYYWLACQVVDISTSTVTLKIINVVKLTGEQGATFTPSVDSNSNLSWTNDRNLPNPETVNIKGEKGDTPTVQVGEVSYVDYTEPPSVTNSGTDLNVVLDFEIPQGYPSLFLKSILSATVNPAPPDYYDWSLAAFNRTPNIGETFISFWRCYLNVDVENFPRATVCDLAVYSVVSIIEDESGLKKARCSRQRTTTVTGNIYYPKIENGILSWTVLYSDTNTSLYMPDPVKIRGEKGADGADGATFTPSVSVNGDLSWTNDGGLANPDSVNIMGKEPVMIINIITSGYDVSEVGNTFYLTDNCFSRVPQIGEHVYGIIPYYSNGSTVSYYVVAVVDSIQSSSGQYVCKVVFTDKMQPASGATFIPSVDDTGELSWTKTQSNPEEIAIPDPVNIRGPVGINFRGAYTQYEDYAPNDVIYYNGTCYICTSETNHSPGTTPNDWSPLALGGLYASDIAQLTSNPAANQIISLQNISFNRDPIDGEYAFIYASCPAGFYMISGRIAVGSSSSSLRIEDFYKVVQAMNWRGEYVDGETYNTYDIISYEGSLYLSKADNVTASPANSLTGWWQKVLTSQLQCTYIMERLYSPLDIPSYEGTPTIPENSFNREPETDEWFYFFWSDIFDDKYYIVYATVGEYGLNYYEANILSAFEITGPKGEKGDTGTAATIKVGTVTTGEAGTEAQVENIGTTSEAVFNFTIPKGEKGDTGATGPRGPRGENGDSGLTEEEKTLLKFIAQNMQVVDNKIVFSVELEAPSFNAAVTETEA